MKKIILTLLFSVLCMSSCFASSWQFVEDIHLVRRGETLDSIVRDFIKKNTYETREFNEFKDGVIELNPWLLKRDVRYLDIIYVNYWVKK